MKSSIPSKAALDVRAFFAQAVTVFALMFMSRLKTAVAFNAVWQVRPQKLAKATNVSRRCRQLCGGPESARARGPAHVVCGKAHRTGARGRSTVFASKDGTLLPNRARKDTLFRYSGDKNTSA